jgi:nucleoside 2-deoxyribosyltransferase
MKIYIASQVHHAERWLEWDEVLRTQHGHRIISSWPVMVAQGVPESPINARVFWQVDVEEVKNADVVVVFADPSDVLRGALVEVGVAFASEVPVICIGDHPSYGTWRYHPLVYHVDGLDGVPAFLELLEKIHG